MTASYLKSLGLQYDTAGGLENNSALAGMLSKVVSSLLPPLIFIDYALEKAKIEMRKPPTTHAGVRVSRNPRLEYDYGCSGKVKALWIDREYDPLQMLDVPKEAKALSEFAYDCWTWALPRLGVETDFPCAFVRELMDRFRAQDYVVGGALKPVRVAGSKADARVLGSISCVRTVLKVEVSYRNEILFERVIWDVPEMAFMTAYTKRECLVQGGFFKVLGAGRIFDHYLLPEASFPLDSLPDSFLKTLT